MGDRRWLFEAQLDGTTVTTGNTQSDTGASLNTVSAGTGGTIVYDASWSLPTGGKSIKLTNQASGSGGGANQVRFAPDTSVSTFATDATFRWSAEVAAGDSPRPFWRCRHATGYIFTLARRSDGKAMIQNAAAATVVTGTATLPTPPSTGIRVEAYGTLATGANSNFTVKLYNASGTLLDTLTVTNADLAASSYTIATWEAFNSGTVALGLNVDSVGIRSGSTTPMGAVTANNPPTIGVTQGDGLAKIDARNTVADHSFTLGLTQVGGTTTTATEVTTGLWLIPQGDAETTWRVTATDTANSLSATQDYVVPAAAKASTRLVSTATGWR